MAAPAESLTGAACGAGHDPDLQFNPLLLTTPLMVGGRRDDERVFVVSGCGSSGPAARST